MGKKINVKGIELFTVVTESDNGIWNNNICTIENTGKDEYQVYNDRGEGFSIYQLDTIDIVELLATNSIDRRDIQISLWRLLT